MGKNYARMDGMDFQNDTPLYYILSIYRGAI